MAGPRDDASIAEVRVKAQLDHAAKLFDTVMDRLGTVERTMQIAVAVVVGAGSLILKEGNKDVLLLLPFVIAMLLAYQSQQFADLIRFAWQREQAIRAIEDVLGPRLFPFDSAAGRTRHAQVNPSLGLGKIAYVLVFLASVVGGSVIAFDGEHPVIIVAAFVFSVILGVATAACAAVEHNRAWQQCEVLRVEYGDTDGLADYDDQVVRLAVELGASGRLYVVARRAIRSVAGRIQRGAGR